MSHDSGVRLCGVNLSFLSYGLRCGVRGCSVFFCFGVLLLSWEVLSVLGFVVVFGECFVFWCFGGVRCGGRRLF